VYLHPFLTSALHGDEGSASSPGHSTLRKEPPDIHWIGGWVGPWAGLDKVAKRKSPCPCGEWNPGHLARRPGTVLIELSRLQLHDTHMHTKSRKSFAP